GAAVLRGERVRDRPSVRGARSRVRAQGVAPRVLPAPPDPAGAALPGQPPVVVAPAVAPGGAGPVDPGPPGAERRLPARAGLRHLVADQLRRVVAGGGGPALRAGTAAGAGVLPAGAEPEDPARPGDRGRVPPERGARR